MLKHNPADKFTNGVNLDILCLWGGNINFQYIADEYTTVMYVCGYMMKREKAMGKLLKRFDKEYKMNRFLNS